MTHSRTLRLVLPWVLAAGLASAASADDHVLSEARMTYMGRTSPPQTSETWTSADKGYLREGRVVVITRHDLGKRWTILTGPKRYLEETLGGRREAAEPPPGPVRIQEYGFEYEPSYEWKVEISPSTETVNGFACRKIQARGVADYAEEVREIWVASDVPIDVKSHYERVVKPGLEPAWLRIVESTDLLRKGLAIRARVTTEPAIAPTRTTEILVTRVERAAPPEGIYELPAGLQRVQTRDELFSR